jgi:hypothetical protein
MSSQSSTDDLRHALRAMVDQRSPAARRELLSALEYPGAGARLAELVTGSSLPELLQWLRPTDGAKTLAVATRGARLGQNTADPTGRRQEDEGRVFSTTGDGPGNDLRRSDDTSSEADPGTDPDALTRVANAFLLTELFEEGRPFDPEPFAKRLAAALEARGPLPVTATAARRTAGVSTQTQRVTTYGFLPHGLKRPEEVHSTSSAAESTYAAVAGRAHAAINLSPVRTISPLQDAAINQRVYIANAGIVLIGPYLPRLFSMLELTHETAFTSTSCAHRAVHLIQYIATGATTTPEPMLVLNKILCGLPISEPIPLDIDLRTRERAAVEEMLTAIIAHWQAIGRTSIAGLRESFLQREGRLVCAEESWQLRVESKCFDMLLDRLPWGYTTVKFPWMKRVLHVDWR